MTPEEINEAVARKMGWVPNPNPTYKRDMERPWHNPQGIHSFVPDYCHAIAAAWEILNYVASHEGAWDLEFDNDNSHVLCTLKPSYIEMRADAAPMAICLAFLKLP